jgi:hypothetical protein
MSTETIERPAEALDTEPVRETSSAPPSFGKCPVCGKLLRPKCRFSGEVKAPPPGTGYESRAKCGGCGTILVYLGNYEWRPLVAGDLTEDDKFADKMGF